MYNYLSNLNPESFVPLFEAKYVLLNLLIFDNISCGRVIPYGEAKAYFDSGWVLRQLSQIVKWGLMRMRVSLN